MRMKTIEEIMKLAGYTKESEPGWHFTIPAGTYMCLAVEFVGYTPDYNNPQVSVAHYYTQNGDIMQDPEMVFEVDAEGWHPVYFQMANPPVFNQAVKWDEAGTRFICRRLKRELAMFAREWDKNMGQQGYVERAKEVIAKQQRADCYGRVVHHV